MTATVMVSANAWALLYYLLNVETVVVTRCGISVENTWKSDGDGVFEAAEISHLRVQAAPQFKRSREGKEVINLRRGYLSFDYRNRPVTIGVYWTRAETEQLLGHFHTFLPQ